MITRSTRRPRIQLSTGDRVFYFLVNLFALFMFVVVLYPLIYVVSSSFSSPDAVLSGKVVFLPVEFSLEGYKTVFGYQDVLTGYMNTILYTVLGTTINIIMTLICAYPLARKTLPFRNFFMFLFTFTMFFGGGLIPSYLLMRDLHMINTIWAIVIPGAISVYNMIIARTYMQTSIPGEMLEAAQVDGCSDARYFFQMVLPLSKAMIAVIALYYAVGHWNGWFNAFIYLNDRGKYPLQLFLREILIANTFDPDSTMDPELLQKMRGMSDLLKYSLIVVSSAPVMLLYPFAQKYFIKGVMIGSVKG